MISDVPERNTWVLIERVFQAVEKLNIILIIRRQGIRCPCPWLDAYPRLLRGDGFPVRSRFGLMAPCEGSRETYWVWIVLNFLAVLSEPRAYEAVAVGWMRMPSNGLGLGTGVWLVFRVRLLP